MKLSELLDKLDIIGARPSKDYVGKMSNNPAMILEEKVPQFLKLTDLEDIQEGVRIFVEKVCIQDFPARFSPQFWLAHAALTTWYKVLEGYLQAQDDTDPCAQHQSDDMLFQLWVSLIQAGPGSSHLEMMDIIMKNDTFPLWKYMQRLTGEKLLLLVNTLRTDFVYKEDVSADHYATLMETHIDKIFRSILSSQQLEECQRPLLDLSLFYHGRMNHVPPHIGPRLSHLCFLICNRYPLENPYVGVDDWVLTRNHLRVIKDVAIHASFTVGSEAQYRIPRTMEKIFEAAVLDNMLEILFKDFMNLLLQLCNYGNCRKCSRLFVAYQNGLFEKLDFKKGFEKTPDWLFDQCISTLTQIASLNTLNYHMDTFIIAVEQLCLLKFTNLSLSQVVLWHKLLVNHVVSGRALLIKEAGLLITCSILHQANALNWKTSVDTGRMLVDIISDTPCTFIQDDGDSSLAHTVQQYAEFLEQLISQYREQEVTGRYTDVIQRCVLKCTDHVKASVSLVCLKSELCDLKDSNYIKEVLFTVDQTLKEVDWTTSNTSLMEALDLIFTNIYSYFREKGYIAVDFNSLLMSISVTCVSVQESHTKVGQTYHNTTLEEQLYSNIVKEFISLLLPDRKELKTKHMLSSAKGFNLATCRSAPEKNLKRCRWSHQSKGTLPSIAPLVPQLVQVIQEAIQQGTGYNRCVELLEELGTSEIKIFTDYTDSMIELFLDWGCLEVQNILIKMYQHSDLGFIPQFETIFSKLYEFEVMDRHLGMELLLCLSYKHHKLFSQAHITELLTMYPEENHQSQSYILNIVRNIASKGLSLLTAGHFSLLMDTKLPPLTLKDRAPILGQFALQSEDYRKPTLEHLMSYVSNKDSDVCLAAMETLVPLLKDNPGYVKKQKTKFKNLWKSSDNDRVKELCSQLLPELKSQTKSQPVPVPVKAKPMPPVKQPMPAKPARPARVTTSVASILPSTLTSPRPATSISAAGDTANIFNKHTASADAGKMDIASSKTVQKELSDLKNIKDKSKNNLSIAHDIKNINDQTMNTQKIKEALPNLKDIQEKPDQLQKQKLFQQLQDIPTEVSKVKIKDGQSTEIENAEISNTKYSKDSKDSQTELLGSTDMANDRNTISANDDSTVDYVTNTLAPSAAVCLRSVGVVNVDRLSCVLSAAGYDNYVDTGGHIQSELEGSARVIIVCVGDISAMATDKWKSELMYISQQELPVIVLKMKQLSLVGSSTMKSILTDKCCIRFYLKPGEESFKGDNWTRTKFSQLLMQLNYNGILHDAQLIKPEYKDLWKLPEVTDTEHTVTDKHLAMKTSTPDVFISYHWGKQKQVEPLYWYLSRSGVQCWMSVYHMSGSESLYNQIAQGLHSCRAVLVCVTSNYTKSANCQQEVNITQALNKPLIPLIIGETKWPPDGEIGKTLKKYTPFKVNLTHANIIDTNSAALVKLLHALSTHVPVSNKQTKNANKDTPNSANDNKPNTALVSSNNNNCRTEEENEIRQTGAQWQPSENKLSPQKTPRSSRYSKRSSSMFEIKKSPQEVDARFTNTVLPRGVTLDEMGYTQKSNRSKSCIIF